MYSSLKKTVGWVVLQDKGGVQWCAKTGDAFKTDGWKWVLKAALKFWPRLHKALMWFGSTKHLCDRNCASVSVFLNGARTWMLSYSHINALLIRGQVVSYLAVMYIRIILYHGIYFSDWRRLKEREKGVIFLN